VGYGFLLALSGLLDERDVRVDEIRRVEVAARSLAAAAALFS
jgi:hypothetical protein